MMSETVTDKGSARSGSKGGPKERKQRLTVSLSAQSMKAFSELRDSTDADSDSEVVRNALRLHLALLRAYASGKKLVLRDEGTDESIPVSLFAPD